MNMTSNSRFFIPLLGAAVLSMMVSCASYNKPYAYSFDESLAPEQTTSIVFTSTFFEWKSYNGIRVRWNERDLGASQAFFPAGQTELVFDLHYASGTSSMGMRVVDGYNLVLSYNFKAQKKYFVSYPGRGTDLYLYELEPGEKIKSSVYKRYDPIKIQVAGDKPTVLE